MIEVTVVLDNEVGGLARPFGFHLRCHPRTDSRFVEPVPRDHTRNTLLQGRYDEHGSVDKTIVPSFEEERHDVHDHLARLSPRLAFEGNAPNVRMEQRVEPLARRRIGKDDVGERRTIERTASHRSRPDARDLAQAVAIGSDDLARDRISIDDECAELREDRRNCALSGTDAAGQSNPHGAEL
jgi:hypothetical protein